MIRPEMIVLRRDKPFRNEDLLYVKSSYHCCWLYYTDGHVEVIGHHLSNIMRRVPSLISPRKSVAVNPEHITRLKYYPKRINDMWGVIELGPAIKFTISRARINDIKERFKHEQLPT